MPTLTQPTNVAQFPTQKLVHKQKDQLATTLRNNVTRMPGGITDGDIAALQKIERETGKLIQGEERYLYLYVIRAVRQLPRNQ